MREIRLSGSEGGGGDASPYPYSHPHQFANDAVPLSNQTKPGHDADGNTCCTSTVKGIS
jgi:hypothetical protein